MHAAALQVDICVHCFTAVQLSPSTKDYGLQTIWCALTHFCIKLSLLDRLMSVQACVLCFSKRAVKALNHTCTHCSPGLCSCTCAWCPPGPDRFLLCGRQKHDAHACRSRYLKSWFLVDGTACFPLECILFAAAPGVNWYNTLKFIRWHGYLHVAGRHLFVALVPVYQRGRVCLLRHKVIKKDV